jgi:hypothetical protein
MLMPLDVSLLQLVSYRAAVLSSTSQAELCILLHQFVRYLEDLRAPVNCSVSMLRELEDCITRAIEQSYSSIKAISMAAGTSIFN